MPSCQHCQASYSLDPKEIEYLKNNPLIFGETKIEFPVSTACPDCRQQIRTAHRNEQFLYQSTSDLSGKKIISIFSPEGPGGKKYTVYTSEEWHSDKWDGLDYGRDFDFKQGFFKQYNKLFEAIPQKALITDQNENCPFTTHTGFSQNCHLTTCTISSRNCYYCKLAEYSNDCVDCTAINHCELCYEGTNLEKCYNSIHLRASTNCSDCHFSENLNGCKNCFLCTNLINQSYCFMNQQLSKEEYEAKIKPYFGSHQNFENFKQTLKKLSQERIHKFAQISNCENSYGDYLVNCQNCSNCYDLSNSQDCFNLRVGSNANNCLECNNTYIQAELCYEVMSGIQAYNCAFSVYVVNSSNVFYSNNVHASKNCFGCTGLIRKEYCILNKQYTKEEYLELVPKIIEHMKSTGEWGNFFPVQYSPHCYNETVAQDYYPLSKEEVLAKGWKWHDDSEIAHYEGPEYQIPDHIDEVPDDITAKILRCEKSGKLYKIIPHELKFYRQLGIPLPHLYPQARLEARQEYKNPQKLYPRNCAKCQVAMQSTFAPEKPEVVYCEKCYLEDVY